MKGSRVQSIIRELRGEKIDIIEWSEDPAIFAANALSPAKVSKVTVVDFENKKLQVIVESDQQSLAIGKRGQNVRLSAKLVGWDIDIRSEEEMKREIAQQMERLITATVVPLTLIEGITPGDTEALSERGVETIEQLADASVDDLCEWLDLSVDEAEDMLDRAREIVQARAAKLGAQEAETSGETADEAAPDSEEAAEGDDDNYTVEASGDVVDESASPSAEETAAEAGPAPVEADASEDEENS
jgi:N utilization substance protein A